MERDEPLYGCTGLLCVGLLNLVLLIATSAVAQTGGSFDLRRSTIDGGGATFSTSGVLSLGGTIGQPDAATLSGGTLVLYGGFWPAVVAALTPTPTSSASPTRTCTATPTVTAQGTATRTPTGVLPPTVTPTPLATGTRTPTPQTSATRTPSPTPIGAHVLVVNATDDTDDGTCNPTHCSLREALNAANADQGPNAVYFDIPSGATGCDTSGVCTIQPNALLPFLTDGNTTIDGYTQPGAHAGDIPVLKIVLDGHDNGDFSGLAVLGPNSIIRGLVIQRFTPFSAIHIQGPTATGNRLEGNFIGTDASGTQPRGNCTPPVSCAGVWVQDGAHDNTIGPDNLIAFNGQGVWVTDSARENTITRNRIHSSATAGIRLVEGGNDELVAPVIVSADATQVSGSACAGCVVEVFSDAADEGATYEGTAAANGAGLWAFGKSGGLGGPNITATATDAAGNTSGFSTPVTITLVCGGDCNGDGAVTVDELLIMVNIALGNTALSACLAGDANRDGDITIDDILMGVNHALSICR